MVSEPFLQRLPSYTCELAVYICARTQPPRTRGSSGRRRRRLLSSYVYTYTLPFSLVPHFIHVSTLACVEGFIVRVCVYRERMWCDADLNGAVCPARCADSLSPLITSRDAPRATMRSWETIRCSVQCGVEGGGDGYTSSKIVRRTASRALYFMNGSWCGIFFFCCDSEAAELVGCNSELSGSFLKIYFSAIFG